MAANQAAEEKRANSVTHDNPDGNLGRRQGQFTKMFVSSEICTYGQSVEQAMDSWKGSKDHMVHIQDPENRIVGAARVGNFWAADFSKEEREGIAPVCQ
jgi:uncharacterized protein YkwD